MKYKESTLQGIYQRVAGAMSGLAEIKVKLDKNATPHYIPKEKKVVTTPVISFTVNDEEDFEVGRGIMVHECSHVLFLPDWKTETMRSFAEEYGKYEDLLEIFNVLADANNEYKVSRVFPHLKKPLANKTEILYERKPELLEHENPFMQLVMRINKVGTINPKYPANYPPFVKKFVDERVESFDKERIYSAKGSKLKAFTKETFIKWCELLKKHSKPQGTKAQQKQAQQLKQLLGQAIANGDIKKQGEINEKLEQLASNIRQNGIPNAPMDRNAVRELNPEVGKNFAQLSIKEVLKKLEDKEGEVIKIPHLGMPPLSDDVVMRIPNGNEIIDYDLDQAFEEGKKINRALKKKVQLQEDYEKRHRSGRLDLEEVRKQVGAMGRIYKNTIFERQNTFNRGGAWAIEVLVDCSGSMSGMMDMAKQMFCTLGYALDGLPNVKYALTGFDCNDKTNYWIVKNFRDKRLNISNLNKLHSGGGTPTTEVIQTSTHRLLNFVGMKKVMVVITDGCPANIETNKQAVKIAERWGIKVIGIGIGEIDAIREVYPLYYEFDYSPDLDKYITSLILRALGQRQRKLLIQRAW
jgi:uncharacterized protein with von Willebrand factor type A (vWA) domain